MTNIFVIGTSKSGKTPVAEHLSVALNMQYLKGSAWVRAEYQGITAERQKFIDEISAYSVQRLRKDPDACLDFIAKNHDLKMPTVIDGFRNPRDFIHLFDYRTDKVVYLYHNGGCMRPSEFEFGVQVIDQYVQWLLKSKMMDPVQYRIFCFDCFFDAEKEHHSDVSLDGLMTTIAQEMGSSVDIKEAIKEAGK